MSIRNTGATRQVLGVFLESPGDKVFGFDVIRSTGLASGTVYPILQRLEGEGWLTSHWEDIAPELEGRPARRLYSINGDGVRAARSMEQEVADRRRKMRGWQRPLPGLEGSG
jgi:DNA-binding PadR family transcriptional regulator